MNLFAELESVLAQNGKIWSDVRAVGSADGFIDLAKFKQLAEATDYDNDWGLYEVPLDLRGARRYGARATRIRRQRVVGGGQISPRESKPRARR